MIGNGFVEFYGECIFSLLYSFKVEILRLCDTAIP
jgi:hypothetical protein